MDFLNPQFVDSVGKIGGLAAILILSLAFIALLIINSKSNAKSADNQTAIINQTAIMQASYNELFGRMVSMMGEMQTGAGERDKQIVAMNEIQRTGIAATEAQNKLLTDQNKLLTDLKVVTTTGHDFTRKLADAVVGSSSDTTTAVGAIGESLGNQITDLQKKLSDLIASIPGVVSEKTINSYSSMKQSFNELSKVFTPILQENQDLKTTLELREDTIKSLNALNLTLQAKLDDCLPPDKVVGHITPSENEEKPTNETSGSAAA